MSDLKFQIRRRNAQGKVTWELWELVRPAGWFRRKQWRYLECSASEDDLRKIITGKGLTHYDLVKDFGADGKEIVYGW